MNSLQSRVLLALILAGFLPVFLIFFVTRTLTGSYLQDSENLRMESLSKEVSRQIRQSMHGIVDGSEFGCTPTNKIRDGHARVRSNPTRPRHTQSFDNWK